MRLMRLGTGFRYLMESVARGDGASDLSSPLTRYYAESGTPPGRFLGAGLSGVNGGRGIPQGTECTEQMLFHMLGECADPVTGEQLGRAAKAGAVAGFDLTFSALVAVAAVAVFYGPRGVLDHPSLANLRGSESSRRAPGSSLSVRARAHAA